MIKCLPLCLSVCVWPGVLTPRLGAFFSLQKRKRERSAEAEGLPHKDKQAAVPQAEREME